MFSVISYQGALLVLCLAQGQNGELSSQQIIKFVWISFFIWLKKKLELDTEFSNLQATTPLLRKIISLRLFGAAPVFFV